MIGRITEILANESANTAGTKTIDLNISDPISQMVVSFKGTNNGNTPTGHGALMITKIEIVDGSDLLFSMSGLEAQALGYYHHGVLPLSINDFRNDVMNIQTFTVDFGRFVWDREIALDPSRFNNLQVKITHNKALGGSAPDAGTLGVFAKVFNPGVSSPSGFLMSKELFAYSLVSSGIETITLPADHPYRNIVIQSIASGKQPHEQFNKITLSIDNDRQVLINNMSTSDLIKFIKANEPINETLIGTGTGSLVDHFTAIAFNGAIQIGAVGTALASIISEQFFGGAVGINVDNAEEFQANVSGYAPHGSIVLPFGRPDEIGDWLDVSQISKLILKLTGGSSILASSTCEITGQQYRKYNI